MITSKQKADLLTQALRAFQENAATSQGADARLRNIEETIVELVTVIIGDDDIEAAS